jgi:hypothetical protein
VVFLLDLFRSLGGNWVRYQFLVMDGVGVVSGVMDWEAHMVLVDTQVVILNYYRAI